MRSLQGGERRLTKLGKGFFRNKHYEYLVHVPVIIRGTSSSQGSKKLTLLRPLMRAGAGASPPPSWSSCGACSG